MVQKMVGYVIVPAMFSFTGQKEEVRLPTEPQSTANIGRDESNEIRVNAEAEVEGQKRPVVSSRHARISYFDSETVEGEGTEAYRYTLYDVPNKKYPDLKKTFVRPYVGKDATGRQLFGKPKYPGNEWSRGGHVLKNNDMIILTTAQEKGAAHLLFVYRREDVDEAQAQETEEESVTFIGSTR